MWMPYYVRQRSDGQWMVVFDDEIQVFESRAVAEAAYKLQFQLPDSHQRPLR
jgi:hypothetical protein